MASAVIHPPQRTKRADGTWWLRDESWGNEGSRCGGKCATKKDGDVVWVLPLLCGRWGCRMCGWRRARWFERNCNRYIESGTFRGFWTFTVGRNVSAEESYPFIQRAFNRLRTRLRQKYGAFEYLWVIEPQADGYAHLHVVVSIWLDFFEVRRLWMKEAPGAYHVNVTAVKAGPVARYMSKYMRKHAGTDFEQLVGDGALRYRHRFGKSRGIQFDPFRRKGEGWTYDGSPYKEVRAWALRNAYVLHDDRNWSPSFSYLEMPLRSWPGKPGPEYASVRFVERQRERAP